MLKVEFHNQEPQGIKLSYVVIAARHKGEWIFVKHKERSTYEIPGGHIEQGEDYTAAAKRELFEETGAKDFTLDFVSVYTVTTNDKTSGGYLFFADVKQFSALPDYEIAEVVFAQQLPENLTYPLIQPFLHEKVQMWLNLQSAKDEIWDVYDSKRTPTGKKHRRADPLPKGEYHIVVHVWLVNSCGKLLITKRAPNKGYPNMWECTGGSAISGDDSLAAAVREVKEETGLDALPENGLCVLTLTRDDSICDVWLFRQDFNINDVKLQENETIDAKYATIEEIQRMIDNGEFIAFHYIDELFKKVAEL